MTRPTDRDVDELERALSALAANPAIPPTYRSRLGELQNAVGAQRRAKSNQLLSEGDLDRFELLMARLQIAVQAQKKELELQLKQYEEREKRLAQLLDSIDEKRKERDAAVATQGRQSRSSRRENVDQTSDSSQ